MKRFPKLASLLLLALCFCAGFTIVFRLMTPYIEKWNTKSVEQNPDPGYEIVAFTNNNVQIVKLSELEQFRRQNPDYSFLAPKDREAYVTDRLNAHHRNEHDDEATIFDLKAVQISDDRQLISVSSDDLRSVVTNKYEATDKEVFPKTSMFLNWRYTPLKLAVSSLGGALGCLVFFFIYRKYPVRRN